MSYKHLPSKHMKESIGFHRPEGQGHMQMDMDSPAMLVMTDLKKINAVTIHPGEPLDAANEKMKRRGIRLLLVVDAYEIILGLVTATDVIGEKPMQYIQSNGGKHADIQVQHIMVPSERLEVLHIKDVSIACIGEIIETLKAAGRQHALVVDNQGIRNERTVRGIFSLNQIARQLGINLQSFEVPHTLAEIAQAFPH